MHRILMPGVLHENIYYKQSLANLFFGTYNPGRNKSSVFPHIYKNQ